MSLKVEQGTIYLVTPFNIRSQNILPVMTYQATFPPVLVLGLWNFAKDPNSLPRTMLFFGGQKDFWHPNVVMFHLHGPHLPTQHQPAECAVCVDCVGGISNIPAGSTCRNTQYFKGRGALHSTLKTAKRWLENPRQCCSRSVKVVAMTKKAFHQLVKEQTMTLMKKRGHSSDKCPELGKFKKAINIIPFYSKR